MLKTAGVLLSLIFFMSLFFYYNREPRLRRAVFFYPARHDPAVFYGEERWLPVAGELKRNVELYVNEALLPATDINLAGIGDENSRLLTAVLEEEHLYLDLSADLLFKEAADGLSLAVIISELKKAIKFNFPRLSAEIVITIAGQQP